MSTSQSDLTWSHENTGAGACFSIADYHRDFDSGDSHSSLELFRESPAKYAAIRVFRTIQPDPRTSSMKVGQALHAVCLEYDTQCRFSMQEQRNQPENRSFWSGPLTLAENHCFLSKKEVELVWRMLMAIAGEPDAWNLLLREYGSNERIFTARHLGDGMLLKCKPDRVLKNGLVVDLKTVDGPVDPLAWSRTLAKWGYHRQAAFYLDVLALAGQRADKFVFVAVSKDPPHEIGIYLCDEESIEQGRRENLELLERLAECRRAGIWKHEWQGKLLSVGVPRWAIDR